MSTPTPRKRKQSTPYSPPSTSSQNGRVFTDSDEIRLLKTFHKVNKATPSSSITTTFTVDSPSFKRINSALNSKFTHAQITDKLRRLRIKYHKQARSKSLIRTPHDRELFKTAKNIWGKKTKARGVENRASRSGQGQGQGQEQVEEEEEQQQQLVGRHDEQERERGEVDLDEYPVLVSEFSKFLPLNVVWKEALKSLGNDKLREMNEKWMMIGLEEAKIVTKKAELVKEQTNFIMQVLGDTATATANGN
ncbi:mediator-associated protein 1-like [Melia azedarach]|uniref:Mediator-associated protein 1-like n=1 Tax=Melia azedarach TaxID=155640 RepID=A0ACC1YMS5_MELAZ|nr:mediator-associated protein 1-like [Melia azedarach]